jgi:hypothetical protein
MVRWTASLITAVAISGLQVAVAAERKMPKFDIAAACRSSGAVETVAGCTRDEQAARGQLAKLWPQFKKSDQSRCVQMVTDLGPSMSSYVELLTCLQAAKIEKKDAHRPPRANSRHFGIGQCSASGRIARTEPRRQSSEKRTTTAAASQTPGGNEVMQLIACAKAQDASPSA